MDDLSFRDRAVFLPTTETLVLADLHVGRDESSGVAFPLGERADLHERLDRLLAHYTPTRVVVAGDVLHSFSRISDRVEQSLLTLTDCCGDAEAEFILVSGNHDTMLSAVWDGPVHDSYRLDDDTVVCHGHEHLPDDAESAARYVVGHDHPAIEIEGQRRPCYLFAEAIYRDTDVLMLPAFNRLAAGVLVNQMRTADFQSPFVVDADAFRPIVYDADSHETLTFPSLGEFRRML